MSESSKTKAKAKSKKKAASGKMSCIDAAAKVLSEKGEPITAKR